MVSSAVVALLDESGAAVGTAAAWIYAGGAHHTAFSYAVTAEQLRDLAEMADLEFLLIDEQTELDAFKSTLR